MHWMAYFNDLEIEELTFYRDKILSYGLKFHSKSENIKAAKDAQYTIQVLQLTCQNKEPSTASSRFSHAITVVLFMSL